MDLGIEAVRYKIGVKSIYDLSATPFLSARLRLA